jgi:Ala-tRNA(Pro) deacylase
MKDVETRAAGSQPAPIPITPEALLGQLDGLGIAYRTHRHPPLHTVEDSKALRGDIPGAHCKNLFLRDRKEVMWLVTLPEDRAVDLKALGDRLGGRLSFGSADRLMRHLGVRPGAVTPFAAVNDAQGAVTVVVDRALLAADLLNFHPLTNEMTIGVSPDDLVRFLRHCGHPPSILDI